MQLKGTATGSNMAPNRASLYVGYSWISPRGWIKYLSIYLFVSILKQQLVLTSSRNRFHHLWQRYTGDMPPLWLAFIKELLNFTRFVNAIGPHFQFTVIRDYVQINFLHILIIKEQDKLVKDLCRKLTDKHTLLHGKSFHSISLKKVFWLVSLIEYAAFVAQMSCIINIALTWSIGIGGMRKPGWYTQCTM